MLYCGRIYVSEGTDVNRQANQKNVIFVNIHIYVFCDIFQPYACDRCHDWFFNGF